MNFKPIYNQKMFYWIGFEISIILRNQMKKFKYILLYLVMSHVYLRSTTCLFKNDLIKSDRSDPITIEAKVDWVSIKISFFCIKLRDIKVYSRFWSNLLFLFCSFLWKTKLAVLQFTVCSLKRSLSLRPDPMQWIEMARRLSMPEWLI